MMDGYALKVQQDLSAAGTPERAGENSGLKKEQGWQIQYLESHPSAVNPMQQ